MIELYLVLKAVKIAKLLTGLDIARYGSMFKLKLFKLFP